MHIDGDNKNNSVDNLCWVSKSELVKNTYSAGKMPNKHGEKGPNAALTNKQAREVKRMYKNGMRIKEISDFFSVNRNVIYYIVAGKTYTDA